MQYNFVHLAGQLIVLLTTKPDSGLTCSSNINFSHPCELSSVLICGYTGYVCNGVLKNMLAIRVSCHSRLCLEFQVQ